MANILVAVDNDFDNDGNLDVGMGSQNSAEMIVVFGNGDGTHKSSKHNGLWRNDQARRSQWRKA